MVPGPARSGMASGKIADVVAAGRALLVVRRLQRRTLAEEHRQRGREEEDAAADREGVDGYAEVIEQAVAADEEDAWRPPSRARPRG